MSVDQAAVCREWRELVFPSLPYIVVYLVTEEAVENYPHFPRCAGLAGERFLCFTNPRIYFPGGCTSPYELTREMVHDLQGGASGAKIRAFNLCELPKAEMDAMKRTLPSPRRR